MEGGALANFTFINNTIKGVNQGVAGEEADVFIGNSVPVRARASRFSACCFPVASRAFTHSSSQLFNMRTSLVTALPLRCLLTAIPPRSAPPRRP